jgi:hypothetical protein
MQLGHASRLFQIDGCGYHRKPCVNIDLAMFLHFIQVVVS